MIRRRIANGIERAGLSLLCAGAFAAYAALVLAQEIASKVRSAK